MRHIPEMDKDEVIKSFEAFLEKNPKGGLISEIQFHIGSDALLMGVVPPTIDRIAAIVRAERPISISIEAAIAVKTPPQSDDWMYQRIPCAVVQQVRQVLAEAIKACTHTDKPTLAGVGLVELLEALRITE